MSGSRKESNVLTFSIPKIKADSETQTSSQIKTISPTTPISTDNMESNNTRKRRNLSKNRARREKTPEPGRTPVADEDTTTSDDEEEIRVPRSSRELEADKTYEQMKKLALETANYRDPVYDIDTNAIMEARAVAATERRRRSVSPYALPDKEEMSALEKKFINPSNKLLSSTYTLSPKDESTSRRSSLVIDTNQERRSSLTILTPPPNLSPSELKDYPTSIPTTPKKLEEMVYKDEIKTTDGKPHSKSSSPGRRESISVFTFDTMVEDRARRKSLTPNVTETQGDIVTKVIQVERTPSKKLLDENKPNVEVRQRVVRTPSRKSVAENKPLVIIKHLNKERKEDTNTTPKLPPVKPPRSRSASRLGGKTSESEMSEDQGHRQNGNIIPPRRRVIPTPRRFMKNRSPRAARRSHSVNRIEDIVVDNTGLGMTQTSRDIIELMRARSLSIPKNDPRVPVEYKKRERILATPNKTPTTLRQTRGISCPKTIQIISDRDILDGLIPKKVHKEATSKRSSGYIEASQSEYTSSCYSTTPSDNEYNFDLLEKKDELTRKLNLLSQEIDKREGQHNISKEKKAYSSSDDQKHGLRRRKPSETVQKETKVKPKTENEKEKKDQGKKTSNWKIRRNWIQFKLENKKELNVLRLQINRCLSEVILLIFICGLGGIMFKNLEGSFENAYKCGTRNVKRDFIESLWRGSSYMREEDWKSMARKKLYEFEEQLHTAHEAGVNSYSGLRSWTFMNSFVYCLTLLTTIGYGHIAPKTTYGRLATIVYAIIGIPLFLIVLADFGKLFTRIIKFFWAFIRRFYYTRSCRKVRRTVPMQEMMKGLNIVYDAVRRPSQIFKESDMLEAQQTAINGNHHDGDSPPPLPPKPSDYETQTEPETPAPSSYEIDDEFNLPISVAIFVLIVYIVLGAACYNSWESWSLFESFYFVFISMSTIGLGDIVPNHPMYMMASILYLVFGLALMSMCINVVQVKLSNTFKQASAKIGATIGLQVAEEDGSLVATTPAMTEIAPIHVPKKRNDVEISNDVQEIDNDR